MPRGEREELRRFLHRNRFSAGGAILDRRAAGRYSKEAWNKQTICFWEGTGMKKISTLFWTFLKIGAFTFGGGYAMVALLEHEFVEEKQWVSREEFLDMVAIAESTPGPVAVNSATYIGYKIDGTAGAAASTVAVCIPSFVVIYCISLFFDRFLSLTVVAHAFRGIQVCVIYLILSAGLKMLHQLEQNAFNVCILAAVIAAMVGCSVAAVSFSSIYYILLSGAAGVLLYLVKKAGAGK
jgi:chromate transporter